MNLESPAGVPVARVSTSSIVSICLWLTALFFITSVLLMSTVPRFEKVFKDFDAELPAPTIQLIHLSNWYLSKWYMVALGWLGTMFACGMLCKTGFPREARLIRNLLAAAVLVLLIFAGVALYLPYAAITVKLN